MQPIFANQKKNAHLDFLCRRLVDYILRNVIIQISFVFFYKGITINLNYIYIVINLSLAISF